MADSLLPSDAALRFELIAEPGETEPETSGGDPGSADPGGGVPVDENAVDSTGGPSAESPEEQASPERAGDPAPQVLAKLYEDEQKVQNRARWAIGGTRRTCHVCRQDIPPQATFMTALTPTSAPNDDPRLAEASELFERLDYCETCAGVVPQEQLFAFWKHVMDAPERTIRKTVNLEALLAYFRHLGEARDEEHPDEGEDDLEAREPRPAGFHVLEPEEELRMRYFLGLFLVRKRVLRWIDLERSLLTLQEGRDGDRHEVIVPELNRAEQERSLAIFEELFS